MANQLKGQKLEQRAVFSITGEDRFTFLQGLITNDIFKVQQGHLLYACLLTPQGKYLIDFFAFEQGDKIMMDCEAHRLDEFIKRLSVFKLRSKVSFQKEDIPVYAFWDGEESKAFPDPRHKKMGFRLYGNPDFDFEQGNYMLHRFETGVPEGDKDILVGSSTVQEAGLDDLNAVDFQKGCYMGQELTARIHYRGLLKRKLFPVRFEGGEPAPQENIVDEAGETIGEIRSVYQNRGFALLKIEQASPEQISQGQKLSTAKGPVLFVE